MGYINICLSLILPAPEVTRGRKESMKRNNRYQVDYGNASTKYNEKDWAIHSAECMASFFCTVAKVVDTQTGEMVAEVIPNESGIGVRVVRY